MATQHSHSGSPHAPGTSFQMSNLSTSQPNVTATAPSVTSSSGGGSSSTAGTSLPASSPSSSASPPAVQQPTQLAGGTLPHINATTPQAAGNLPQTPPSNQPGSSTSAAVVPPANGSIPQQNLAQSSRSRSRFALPRFLTLPSRRSNFTGAPKEWKSTWLQFWALIILLLVTLGLAGTILGLAQRSNNKSGITRIRNSSPGRTIAGVTVGLSLTWKQIPVFAFQAYSFCVAATVRAYADRQPFVELWNAQGASAKLTVLLNYAGVLGPVKPWRAIRNKHVLIGFLFIMNFILSFLVTPFAASLLYLDNEKTLPTATKVNRTTFFDEGALKASTQLYPMLNYVDGIQLYDTPLPAWTAQTNHSYSFAPFELPTALAGGTNNLTVEQTATFLSLECRELTRGSDYEVTDAPGKQQWNVVGSDRGCGFNSLYSHAGVFQNYAQTFAANDCPPNFSSSEGRIFLFAAHAPDGNGSAVRDFDLISCTSTYYNHTGQLEVALDPSSSRPVVRRFAPTGPPSAMEPRPEFWKLFEKTVNELRAEDPTATWAATILGRCVVETAAQNATISEAFQASRLIPSLESTMSLVYAVTAATYFRSALSTRAAVPTMNGTLYPQTNVLRMVPAIAYSFFGILFLNAVLVILVILSMLRTRSILYEEPAGILSYAVLAANSADLTATAETLRGTVADGRCTEAYQKGVTLPGDYRDSKWAVKDWTNVASGRIDKV
ncbi:hypothetical protein LTR47_006417 [Exophiala xenobiotica]|nr:hypothetical protein LTR47_006417 [Exophiala xenobiotica]KAK5251644.1 hypothetical protein LTS06_003788 [Exophiala xenobiotica]KAK5323973.1 hypothetical protein LTR93_004759 [Exophiala xenobiotica]KAK5355299.1 hypothetical protein LTR61_000970 [Exophiala xenobiotica]KAK5368324.1 hypothetical protein LTR11_007662 [Exophiala xenobiotica]